MKQKTERHQDGAERVIKDIRRKTRLNTFGLRNINWHC